MAGESRPRANGQATYLDLTNLPTTIRYCLGCRDVREGVPWRVYNVFGLNGATGRPLRLCAQKLAEG